MELLNYPAVMHIARVLKRKSELIRYFHNITAQRDICDSAANNGGKCLLHKPVFADHNIRALMRLLCAAPYKAAFTTRHSTE